MHVVINSNFDAYIWVLNCLFSENFFKIWSINLRDDYKIEVKRVGGDKQKKKEKRRSVQRRWKLGEKQFTRFPQKYILLLDSSHLLFLYIYIFFSL